jgi:transposase
MYYIGIDVSTKESALSILDGKGKIVRETKLPTDPEIIARFVAATGLAIERFGLESGCTAAWLFARLQRVWLAGDMHRCAARGRGAASRFPQQE